MSERIKPDELGERVVFNVGGLRYETTRTTILTYPDSLLARMLSTENSDMIRFEGVQNNEIFLDRNGKLFEYVLDYYRNGAEIIIPTGVSPKAVERELVYFGFDVSGIVHSFTSGPATSPVPAAIPTSLKAGDCSTISTSTWADEKKNPIILIDDPRAPVPDDGLPSSSFEVMRHSEFLGFNSMGYSLNSRHYFIADAVYHYDNKATPLTKSFVRQILMICNQAIESSIDVIHFELDLAGQCSGVPEPLDRDQGHKLFWRTFGLFLLHHFGSVARILQQELRPLNRTYEEWRPDRLQRSALYSETTVLRVMKGYSVDLDLKQDK